MRSLLGDRLDDVAVEADRNVPVVADRVIPKVAAPNRIGKASIGAFFIREDVVASVVIISAVRE